MKTYEQMVERLAETMYHLYMGGRTNYWPETGMVADIFEVPADTVDDAVQTRFQIILSERNKPK